MDPDATWRMLCATLSALEEHSDDQDLREQAIELLDALVTWLRRGGFPPTSALD
jgi:hypothetical protein